MKNSAKTARLPIQDDTLIHKRGLRLPPLNDNFSAQQTSETAVQTPIQSPTSVLVDFSSRNDFSIDSHQQTTTTTSKIPSSSQSVSSRQNLSQTPTIKRTSTYTASKVGRLSRPTTSVTNTSTHSSQRSVGGRRTRQSRPSTKSRVQSATTKKKEPHPFEEREFSRMIFSPSSRFFHTEMVNVFLPDHNHPANPEIDKLDTYSSLPTPQSRQPLTLSLDDFSKWRPHYYLKSAWDGKIAQLDGSFNNLSQQQLRYRQTAKGVVYTPNESSSDKESPDPHSFYLAESLNHDSDVYRLQLIHRKLLQHRNCLGQDTLPIASPPLPKQPCQSATDISKLYSSLVSSIFFHQPLPLLSYERVFLTEEKRKLDESRRSVKIPQKTKQRIWK
ncbi:hypothetical protein BLNAU_7330 [Blattamonas nauphoetae]|uniref:Uncharacterized protein n=1 Tax=Blattamonas nauphoetae TaxID=2049346 RepID=A0ABQ9Y1Q9_9EUKA|nr:hypothetical protein BLNAU_7330 [Blattamonas nauphoetae]